MSKKLQSYCIILFFAALSLILSYLMKDKFFNLGNIYENVDSVTLRVHVEEESSSTNGRMVFIPRISVNGSNIDLRDYASEEWKWYENYHYLVFEGESEDLTISLNRQIKSIELAYYCMDAGGIIDVYVNEELLTVRDLFLDQDNWRSGIIKYTFVDRTTKWVYILLNAIFLFIFFLAFFFSIKRIYVDGFTDSRKNKIGIGAFNGAKGIAISLVIIEHSMIFVSPGEGVVYTNALMLFLILLSYGIIPMFFMISGYGFRPQKMKECIKQQFGFLIWPYITLTFAIAITSAFYHFILEKGNLNAFLHDVLAFLSFSFLESDLFGISVGAIGAIWYCLALCVGWILTNLIVKLDGKVANIAVLVCVCGSFIFSKLNFNYFGIGQSLMAVPFIYIGYKIKKRKVFINNKAYMGFLMVGSSVLMCAIAIHNGVVESHADLLLGNNFFVGMILSAYFGFLCMWLYLKCYQTKLRNTCWFEAISNIGSRSFDILFIHTYFMLMTPWEYLRGCLPDNRIVAIGISIAIQTGLVYVVLLFKDKVFKRNRRNG